MRAAVVCVLFALMVLAPVVAFTGPTTAIQTDKSSYQSGDTIAVTLGAWNPDACTTLDVYVGLLPPGGGIYTMGPNGWELSIAPWGLELRMPKDFDMTTHFYFQVPSTAPMPPISQGGDYFFASVLMYPGTWTWACDASLAPFTYNSGGPSIEITMIPIPAASFSMGSPLGESDRDTDEGPQRTVNISEFLMSATEITQKQFRDVTGWNESYYSGDGRPVTNVTWYDCVSFCNELSEADGYTKCYTITNIGYSHNHIASADVTCDFGANGYRLPTEAEWEYACRAGTTTRFYTGDSDSDLERAGWYYGNSGATTHSVGEKEANAWGLYDMHGNVWEWCWDWYSSEYYESQPDPDSDPTGPGSGPGRIERGGCCFELARLCRSANRYTDRPDVLYCDRGFRVVRSVN